MVIINIRCSLIEKREWSSGNTSLSCSKGPCFKSHSQFLVFISACVHPVYILRVIINVRCSFITKSEWSSGNTSLSCSRGPGFKSRSQFLLFIFAYVHHVYILRVIINVICSLIKKIEWSSGNSSLSCSRGPGFKSHSQFLIFISPFVHPVYILRVIINVRCSLITKREWSSGNTSLTCSRGPWFKSHSQFIIFIFAHVHHVYILRVIINVIFSLSKKIEWSSGNCSLSCFRCFRRPGFESRSQFLIFISDFVHPVYILRVIINVRCSLITKRECSRGNNSLSCSRGPWFKSHSQFLLFISASVHHVYILRVIINVRCSLIKKSEWSSGNTSLSCSRGLLFKSQSQFLLFISACVHSVYILRVIFNVRCSLINKSEWSSGNTSLSCSRGPCFKSRSQFLLFISACVHPVYILRVIINVRCSLIKKSEWSSGNTSLSCSRRPWFKSHSQFLLFISACVHTKGYN